MKNKKRNKKPNKESQIQNKTVQKPMLGIIVKFAILVSLLLIVIFYSDRKGFFEPDQTNNHTERKWNAFYEFNSKNNVDVLILGNSHLYTGINPKNLSLTLGANSFVIAAPGTHISDTYFGLKEAIKSCKPNLVIIETYGINNFDQYELKNGGLSDQFKSFSARKDLVSKVSSTPFLFSLENFLYAWSNTIRNHDYLFNNKEQLEKNKILTKNSGNTKNEKLYLGRYVRFTTGIEKDILEKYEADGAPVDGNSYTFSKQAEKYVDKIVELCEKENIELMFLTLPMYHKHIKNYPVWRDKIAQIIDKYPNKWLNMQLPYNKEDFNPNCFENTYNSNQHMTYQGSLIATYKLADYIKREFEGKLTNRKNDIKWHQLFYGDEGYFENFPPSSNDKKNKLICTNKSIKNGILEEVSVIKNANDKQVIIAKIKKDLIDTKDLKLCKLQLAIKYIEDEQEKSAVVSLKPDRLHNLTDMAIFSQNIKPLNVTDIIDGLIVCKLNN